MQNKIYSLELPDNGVAASFVLRTMEEIADRRQGVAGDPLIIINFLFRLN